MTTEGSDLTRRQQELVALGASVAANCGDCLDAHLSAARAVGLTDDELLAAVATAHAVTVEAAGEWPRRVRRSLGLEQPPASTPPSVDSPLAAVGAAMVVGDQAMLDRQSAAVVGLSARQWQHAFQIATRVQVDAANIRLAAARAALWESSAAEASAHGEPRTDTWPCGCGGGGTESESGERPRARGFACCG